MATVRAQAVATRGTVRVRHDADGWGVVECPETPGGCWVHGRCGWPAGAEPVDAPADPPSAAHTSTLAFDGEQPS